METERQLLDAIRGGDSQAMRRLYDRFSGYAMAISLRYISGRDDVRDVMQDSFVSILTSIGDFEYRGEGSLKAWVTKIVTNRALDWINEHDLLKTTDVMPKEEIADEEEPQVELVPPDVLNQMIGRLPVGRRLVLNLHVFEQLSHKEIARRLGIKEASSASQFFYAKKLLIGMINDYLTHKGNETGSMD